MTAALAAGLAAALALGGLTDPVVLLPAVALTQVLLALTWHAAVGAPAARTAAVIVVATGVAADVAVLAADAGRPMAGVGPVLALALLAMFGQQLFRRAGREALTASLAATGAAVVLAGSGSAWLALDGRRDGAALLLVGAAAVLLAPAADLAGSGLGTPRWAAALVAWVLTGAAALAVVAGTSLDLGVALAAATVASVAARLGVLLGNRTAVPHPALPAVLAALLVGPAVHVLARVLSG